MMMVMYLLLREADWAMGGAALGLLAALVEMFVGKVKSIVIVNVITISIISSISEISFQVAESRSLESRNMQRRRGSWGGAEENRLMRVSNLLTKTANA